MTERFEGTDQEDLSNVMAQEPSKVSEIWSIT